MSENIRASINTLPSYTSIQTGKRAIRAEIDGLVKLADNLSTEFDDAVNLIFNISGKTIVTGMGKSGLIAKKISSTLASIGVNSIFVHPAEASHGDLGMICQDDVIIIISKSGETGELSDIVAYASHFNIPVIAITSKKDSSLAKTSKSCLILPDVPEACFAGVLPTTSTTMTLALGDALSVAIAEKNGFTPEQFRLYHPGGSLGQRLSKVSDIMNKHDIPLCNPDTLLTEAIIIMTSYPFGCVGVIDENGELKGIITDGDLRRHMNSDLLSRKVSEIMTCNPVSVSPDTSVPSAIELMASKEINALFIVEKDKPIGILHIHETLKAVS